MELLPLVCLCLLSCSGDAVRVVVEEDSDAVLPCLIRTKEDLEGKFFDWKKDGQKEMKEVFMYDAGIHYNNGLQGQDEQFKGRVSFFQDQLQNGDASIKITRTKMADSGTYSCDFPRHQPRQTSIIELVVGIHSEGEQFKGRVSFFQDQLKNGDASIKITRTKMADSGTYSCDFPRHQPRQTSIIELVVDPVLKDRTGENIPGAALKPVINILAVTKDWVLLQCEARGVSPLTVEMKNGAGNILNSESTPKSETGSPSSITLNINVTKTDDYSCVATQKQFSHQVAAVTSVYISVPPPEPGSNTGYVAIIVVLTILLLLSLLFVLYLKGYIPPNSKKGSTPNTANGPTATESSHPMI